MDEYSEVVAKGLADKVSEMKDANSELKRLYSNVSSGYYEQLDQVDDLLEAVLNKIEDFRREW